MLAYQTKYVENLREILRLCDLYAHTDLPFEAWYEGRRQAEARLLELKAENTRLLTEELFPVLDQLHEASPETIQSLDEFADVLMDWKTNLDCGIYVLIHDAFLSLCRYRKDRAGIIRELYKLGMGLYYLNRMVQSMSRPYRARFYFRDELVFTEAGSYIKYFPEIEDDDTKGYIIRSLANISIAAIDKVRKVEITSRVLQIVQDDYYRSLAPSLPWDVYLRRTHQQMSSCRDTFSRGSLSPDQLAAVLESCHEVFKPEDGNKDPNVRWLWPYYEMEYNLGFVDLTTTLKRLEHLIFLQPEDQYDIAGLYGNVQLAIYYGQLVHENPSLQEDGAVLDFLSRAYHRMLRILTAFPLDLINDYMAYLLGLVISNYYETSQVPTYRQFLLIIMKRYYGKLYISSRKAADLMVLLAETLLEGDPSLFDDIPFLADLKDPEKKKAAILAFARDNGLYHNVGLIKMNVERLLLSRSLLENEYQLEQMHTISGYEDLKSHPSTSDLADAALGHHRWYNGSAGYPEEYVRSKSPYRVMTDLVQLATYLVDHPQATTRETCDYILSLEHRRFSPLVTVCLNDKEVVERIDQILTGEHPEYYREVYEDTQKN